MYFRSVSHYCMFLAYPENSVVGESQPRETCGSQRLGVGMVSFFLVRVACHRCLT